MCGGDCPYEQLVGALALSHDDPNEAMNQYFDAPDRCIATGMDIVERIADAAVQSAPVALEPEPEHEGGGMPRAMSASGERGRRLRVQGSRPREEEEAGVVYYEGDLPSGCFLLDVLCYMKLRLPTLNKYHLRVISLMTPTGFLT
eukprot:COSAG01_NODE_3110_length_6571_cov_218.696539_8_plen_145_part_00